MDHPAATRYDSTASKWLSCTGRHSRSDLGRISGLDEEFDCLTQICRRVFDRVSLARNVELGTQRHVAAVFAIDHCGESSDFTHDALLYPLSLRKAATAKLRQTETTRVSNVSGGTGS